MRPRVLEEAEDELLEAMFYYEDRREGLGTDFFEAVTETMCKIGATPLRFPIYEGQSLNREFRRAQVARFPYVIVYEVRENDPFVVAVAHTSREPGYWKHRAAES